MTIDQIAKITHEANRYYCESIGDTSQPTWGSAHKWQVDSAKNGVKLHLENTNLDDSASHNAWLKEKKETGWKYGEVKDADLKTIPVLYPIMNYQQSKE